MPSYHSYPTPSTSRERRGTGYAAGCRHEQWHTNAANLPPRPSYRSFEPHHSYESRRKYPHVPPLIHQHYPPTRRWPPLPVAEDEAVSLSKEHALNLPDTSEDEARFRGEIDQQPLIIAIRQTPSTGVLPDSTTPDRKSLKSKSSSEASSPRTPVEQDCINVDRRYVYIPEKGIEIPLTYDEPRTPKYEKQAQLSRGSDDSGSRKELSRLNTNLPAIDPPRDRSSRHERAPSPYAYTPQPSQYTMNPVQEESMAAGNVVKQKQGFNLDGLKDSKQPAEHTSNLSTEADKTQPLRPSIHRCVSDMSSPGESYSGGESGIPVESTPYPVSSDESGVSEDESSAPRMQDAVGFRSPQPARNRSTSLLEDLSKRRVNRQFPRGAENSPTTVASTGEKQARPTYIKMPSSRGVQYVHALPTNPGLQYEGMPSLSPEVYHRNLLPSSPVVRDGNLSPPSARGGRRFSPEGSLTTSPYASPPGTSQNKDPHEIGHDTYPRNPPPGVVPPSSPSSRPERLAQRFSSSDTRISGLPVDSISSRSQSRSRSPSPDVPGVSHTHAPPSIDVRAASPARPANITRADSVKSSNRSSQHTTLTPLLAPQPPDLKTLVGSGRRRALSNVETRPKVSFGEPRSETLNLPRESARAPPRSSSHQRTVSSGSQPLVLLPCPRPIPVAGFTDWYSLIDHPSFSICPSCRRAMFSAGYEKYFTPSRRDSAGYQRRCDMDTPWMRMAILLTMSTKRPDPKLIYALADIIVDELPCPGKALAVCQWYRVVHPESGRQVSGFNVCPCCVRNLETMFPALRGVFQKSRSRYPSQERICDLRGDSKRFAMYIDLLESTAKQAQEFKRAPNMLRFTDLAEQMAAIPECSRDDMLRDRAWHTIPEIPELTVCEDCYREVVRPAARQGYFVAEQFSRKAQRTSSREVGTILPG